MSVSIITFANLGKKNNLKTPDILPVIEKFQENGELDQVVCQINDGFGYKNVTSALSWTVRFLIKLCSLFGIQLPREFVEKSFDFFASRKVKPSPYYLFHGGYFLPKTFNRCKKIGSKIIDLAVTAHFATNSKLEREEFKKLNMEEDKGTYTKLYKECDHCNSFDYVIAISDFVKQTYIEVGYPGDHIYVAYPDVDQKRFRPLEKTVDKKFIALYVADTQPLKGLHYLLDAWKDLRSDNAELWIVGSINGPDKLVSKYKDSISSSNNIKYFEHSLTPEEYYTAASVFVFPSLTEGFGRVTLEAMSCGLSVITTENAKGIVEDGKTGFVVPIRDAKAIKEKIELLYNNPDTRDKMGKEARRAVENKKPFGKAVYEIYEEILKKENEIRN